MTIAEYVEYKKKVNENHIINTKSYLPIYFSKSTSTHDPIQKFAHYFGPNQPGTESDCDSKDMEEHIQHFEEMDGVDGWLNAEITKHMIRYGQQNIDDTTRERRIQKLRGNSRDRLDSYSFGNLAEFAAGIKSLREDGDNLIDFRLISNLEAMLREFLIFLDYRVTLGFGSTGGLDLDYPINRLPCHDGIQWVLGRITNSLPGVGTNWSPHISLDT
ncbi:hypothetical protein Tco_0396330 [Tanacetum coccineum]